MRSGLLKTRPFMTTWQPGGSSGATVIADPRLNGASVVAKAAGRMAPVSTTTLPSSSAAARAASAVFASVSVRL